MARAGSVVSPDTSASRLDVVAHADWVIDLGPDGGDAGGTVVFEGPPAALVAAAGSFTGQYLARHVGARP